MSEPAKKIKLVLDASAVERLIGGNSEMEIEIRQCIAAEFAKRHFSTISQNNGIKAAVAEFKAELPAVRKELEGLRKACIDAAERIVLQEIAVDVHLTSYAKSVKLNALVTAAIKDSVAAEIRAEIQKQILDACESFNACLTEHINKLVFEEITTMTKSIARREILKALETVR